MQAPEELAAQYRSDKSPSEDGFGVDTWTWWNRFHSIANVEKKIGLALEVSADLPEQSVIDRWLGEPIRCAILPTSIWLTNKKGFPVLSRAHQQLVRGLFKLHVQFVVSGPLRHQHFKLYQQYLEHIIRVNQEMDPLMDFARGYEDYLQCPLQPLMDNLESQTYEVFEKDPVKYSEYERAMYLAICDKIPEEEKDTKEIVLMVVGAGRGPLVRRALAAAKAGHRKIKIYAVEKNPNAVVTLQAQQDEDWGDQLAEEDVGMFPACAVTRSMREARRVGHDLPTVARASQCVRNKDKNTHRSSPLWCTHLAGPLSCGVQREITQLARYYCHSLGVILQS
ncbi:hypothetical protein C7M84_023802 [Penaeus vannamei]|uniref:Protein arginine N-methyltransferase 5 n=1 Tax=Penaeus vannamei TaxID=6689 RepID=A0A3R7MQ81_PENVA|nr:hypothetical protein C7M84_023802 [Penaeus vannamei]